MFKVPSNVGLDMGIQLGQGRHPQASAQMSMPQSLQQHWEAFVSLKVIPSTTLLNKIKHQKY